MQTNTHNDELQKRLAFFEDQCRARGLRVTNQRRENLPCGGGLV